MKMKNKKGQGGIVGAIVVVILAVVMLGVIFTMVKDRTTTFSSSQNLINYSGANTGALDTNLLLTKPTGYQEITGTPTLINTTGSVATLCNLTSVSEQPYIRCSVNMTSATQLINVSYSYLKEDYYTGGTTRTIGAIIPILLAVGILTLIAFVLLKR